ncbi:MAG: ABC transporter ATP-binding protein [Paracoccaceae bacterium]
MKATLADITVKRRGKAILGPVSFEFGATGVTMVLGPNGSGKTTLLKVLHGVERTSGGVLSWDASEDEAHSAQAYVFQTPIMLRRTVRQNLAFPLELARTPKSEIAAKVTEWAERIGLSGALERPAPRLSGGEKQKLAIGRALIRSPKVLFLDEPCANLDGRSTREIEALLSDAHTSGTRIIMTTHDIGQAKRLASDVLFLLNGKLHDHGDAPAFFTSPGTPETQAFLQGDIVE